MEIKQYFERTKGNGFLATADENGIIDIAVYALPYFIDDATVGFLTSDQSTINNLEHNPHATYFFNESGKEFAGKRLFLTLMRTVPDIEAVGDICSKCDYSFYEGLLTGNVSYFKIDEVKPLV